MQFSYLKELKRLVSELTAFAVLATAEAVFATDDAVFATEEVVFVADDEVARFVNELKSIFVRDEIVLSTFEGVMSDVALETIPRA